MTIADKVFWYSFAVGVLAGGTCTWLFFPRPHFTLMRIADHMRLHATAWVVASFALVAVLCSIMAIASTDPTACADLGLVATVAAIYAFVIALRALDG